MNEKMKDVLIRAVKTFIQGALALIIPTVASYFNGSIESIDMKTILFPAIAAGISAVWNLCLNYSNKE